MRKISSVAAQIRARLSRSENPSRGPIPSFTESSNKSPIQLKPSVLQNAAHCGGRSIVPWSINVPGDITTGTRRDERGGFMVFTLLSKNSEHRFD